MKMELGNLPAWNSTCKETSKILGLNSIHSARKGKPGKQSDAQHPMFENPATLPLPSNDILE